MGRKALVVRPRKLTIHLNPGLAHRLELFLIEPTTGKVKVGGYQRFFEERIREFFDQAERNSRVEQGLLSTEG